MMDFFMDLLPNLTFEQRSIIAWATLAVIGLVVVGLALNLVVGIRKRRKYKTAGLPDLVIGEEIIEVQREEEDTEDSAFSLDYEFDMKDETDQFLRKAQQVSKAQRAVDEKPKRGLFGRK